MSDERPATGPPFNSCVLPGSRCSERCGRQAPASNTVHLLYREARPGFDYRAFFIPQHRSQVTLPPTGARILIASDGLWDAVAAKTAAHHVRSLPATKAVAELVYLPVLLGPLKLL